MVRALPPTIESHVVAGRTEHLDQFPIDHLTAPGRLRAGLGRTRARIARAPYLGDLTLVAHRLRPDILHAHFGTVGWAALRVRSDVGRHVVSFYGIDVDFVPRLGRHWQERYRHLFKATDLILCLGPNMKSRLVAQGCPPEKLVIHHLGVDISRIPFVPRVWDATRPLRILMAASFREKKGIPIGIKAVARVRADLGVELTIVGDASPDRRSQLEKHRIASTILSAGLGQHVQLLGNRPYAELLRLAYDHDVFLAPSVTASDGDAEGTPMTILEMAASGMPVISTRHADIPELIIDGRTGLLADERDVDGLAKLIRRLAADNKQWGSMLKAARGRIETDFDVARQSERLSRIYRAVGANDIPSFDSQPVDDLR